MSPPGRANQKPRDQHKQITFDLMHLLYFLPDISEQSIQYRCPTLLLGLVLQQGWIKTLQHKV